MAVERRVLLRQIVDASIRLRTGVSKEDFPRARRVAKLLTNIHKVAVKEKQGDRVDIRRLDVPDGLVVLGLALSAAQTIIGGSRKLSLAAVSRLSLFAEAGDLTDFNTLSGLASMELAQIFPDSTQVPELTEGITG